VDLARILGGRGQQLRDEITAQVHVEESWRRVVTPENANQTFEMEVKGLVPAVRADLAPA